MNGFDGISEGWLTSQLAGIGLWLTRSVLNWSVATQVAVTLAALLAARLLAPRLRRLLAGAVATRPNLTAGRLKTMWQAARVLALPGLWLAGQWLATLLLVEAGRPHRLVEIAASLLTAWLAIRLSTAFLADRGWSRLVAGLAWSVAALDITGLLNGTIHILDRVGLDFGDTRLSLLLVIKAFVALGLLLWLSGLLSRLMERRILALPNLSPSAQVLFTKVTKVTLVTLGIVIALKSVGIDLSAFALLSGAIGVGVGFGLQKVVSNLISGVILLLDKSIKPGDVIGVGDTYGWIASLGARYVSVVTRDGIEHLIPNEELITQRVQNWSFSHSQVRLKIPVSVAYDSDLPRAMILCVQAAAAVSRVLADPPPQCLFTGFGASALDLELRCWIDDPKNGVGSAKSEVLLGIWTRFRAEGIKIPYPQSDVHIRTMPAAERLI
jgi:small-conductance mechanosensitive channel